MSEFFCRAIETAETGILRRNPNVAGAILEQMENRVAAQAVRVAGIVDVARELTGLPVEYADPRAYIGKSEQAGLPVLEDGKNTFWSCAAGRRGIVFEIEEFFGLPIKYG